MEQKKKYSRLQAGCIFVIWRYLWLSIVAVL